MSVRTPILQVMIAFALLLAMSGQWANAQYNPFFDPELALTPQDLQPLEATASRLLNMDPPKVGTTEMWNNPATGVRGTVTLTRVALIRGLPCRDLRYVIVNPRLARPTDVTFTWCRAASGEWKILQ
jgi:hypothetical protein